MTFTRLLAPGILTHKVFALCSDGKYYLDLCFLPTFGLMPAPSIMRWITPRLNDGLHNDSRYRQE